MEISPRYEGPAVIDITAVAGDPSAAVIRQRDRLATELSDLSPAQWTTPSRCVGWTVQDVAEHLASVNRFWTASVGAGVQGEPTRFLASFDPVTVPAALVEGARGAPPEATLDELTATSAELATLLRSLSADDWAKAAEAPPGHITIAAVGAHALWDAWIHERDVLLPLGREQQIEPDELSIALPYAAALGPAFHLIAGRTATGSLTVQAHRPEVSFTVDVADQVRVRPGTAAAAVTTADAAARAEGPVFEGEAVDLLEGFSVRGPLPPVGDDHRWLVDGLSRAFGSAG